MGLGIRGWRQVGLGLCKVGGVGSGLHPPAACQSRAGSVTTQR